MEFTDICNATAEDTEDILALYKSLHGGAAGWNEHYPDIETVEYDLRRDSLFILRDADGKLAAVLSIYADPEVERLECWTVEHAGELSRIGVRKDLQGRGLAAVMMRHGIEKLKERGFSGVHILVAKGNERALKAYSGFGYSKAGECQLFERQFECYEKRF